jgi:hypothetical protein
MKLLNVSGGFFLGFGAGLLALIIWIVWMASHDADQ